jgi:hypothetical protein
MAWYMLASRNTATAIFYDQGVRSGGRDQVTCLKSFVTNIMTAKYSNVRKERG